MIKYLAIFLSLLLPVQAAFESYSARYNVASAENEWYTGSNTVFVGSAIKWDHEHEPAGWYNTSTGSLVKRWDFEATVDCNTTDETCSLPGFQLPNGTEVKFATTGELPSPIQASWGTGVTNRRKVYCIVNSTPDNDRHMTSTLDKGSFGIAEKTGASCDPNASPINLTSSGSGTMKMSFLGAMHIIQLDVDPYVGVTIDTSTDQLTTAIASGLVTNNKVQFLYDKANTLPTGVVTHGFGATYCALVSDTTHLYLRQIWNDQASCVNANFPGSNTGTMQCIPNPATSTAGCSITSGTYPGETTAITITSIDSGSVTNVTAGTTYYTIYVATSGSSFAFAATPEEAMDSDKIIPDANFTATWSAPVKDFTDTGTNVLITSKSISGGSNTYIRDNVTTGNPGIHGYPQGTIFAFMLNYDIKTGAGMGGTDWYGAINLQEGAMGLLAKVPAVSTPGDVTVDVSFGPNPNGAVTGQKKFSFPLHIVEFTPLTRGNPTDFSTSVDFDTALAEWEQLMIDDIAGAGGRDLNSGTMGCTSPDRESFAGLYAKFVTDDPDGAGSLTPGSLNYAISQDQRAQFYARHNFFLAAKYVQKAWTSDVTDQENFEQCGKYLAYWYANLLDSAPSQQACCGPTGTESLYYAHGLYKNANDPFGQMGAKFRHAIERQVNGAQVSGGRTGTVSMRENSWVTNIWYHHYRLTGELLPYYVNSINVQIGNLYDQAMGSETVEFEEPFIGGVAGMTLIHYYMNVHKDERIPFVIKAYLDHHWTDATEAVTYRQIYNPLPRGKGCWIGCEQATDTKLQAYLVPFYWAVWRWTGDSTYKDRGDTLFQHMLDDGVPYTMKQWNQLYFTLLEWGIPWRFNEKNPW
jgi:hypothetical protein